MLTQQELDSIRWCGLNPDNWTVLRKDEHYITLGHKETGQIRYIPR